MGNGACLIRRSRRHLSLCTLYLAVPDVVYNGIFSTRFCQEVVAEACVAILVYNVREEVIVQWIR